MILKIHGIFPKKDAGWFAKFFVQKITRPSTHDKSLDFSSKNVAPRRSQNSIFCFFLDSFLDSEIGVNELVSGFRSHILEIS